MSKSWCTGADAVMQWFDNMAETPYYSLWMGSKQIVASWAKEDQDEGRSQLERNLRLFQENRVSDLMTIKLLVKPDRDGFITAAAVPYASLNFRPCDVTRMDMMSGMPDQVHFPNNPGMQRMSDTLDKIDQRLGALESGDDEPRGWEGVLYRMMDNPEIQTQVIGAIQAALPGVKFPPLGVAGAIGNIPQPKPEEDNVKIDVAINILLQYDPQLAEHLTLLANLAMNNPSKYQFAISMLKSNG